MAKKQRCKKGAPQWMTTYGDMVTLLLTFFVAMVSMSTISPGKFQQVAAGIRLAFGGTPPSVLLGGKSIVKEPLISAKKGMYEELMKLVADPRYKGKITIQEREEGTLIVLKNMVFFKSGSARLTKEAKELLAKVGAIIIEHTLNTLEIYGYADDRLLPPNSIYASNWHLGAARAASVAHFFAYELRRVREVERLAEIRAGRFDIDMYYNPDRFVPIGVGDKEIIKEKKSLDEWKDAQITILSEKFKRGQISKSQWEKGKRETEREYIKQLEDLRNKYRRIDILIRKEAM